MIYEFTPTQDLHGYDSPWPAGGGKNLLDSESVFANLSSSIVIKTLTLQPNTEYTASTNHPIGSGTTASVLLADMTESISSATCGFWNGTSRTKTTDANGQLRIAYRLVDKENVATFMSYHYQLEEGSSATSYAPYSNICPISGYNIWDPVNNEMIQVYSGYVDAEARKLYLHPVYEEYDGEELVGPWMSSMDEYTEEGTPTTGAFVVDFGGEVTEYDITDFMLQTLLDSLGIRRFITSGAMLLNSLMDQAQGRVRSEAELLNRSSPIHVIAIGKELPTNLVIKKPVSDVLPVLPGNIKI